MIAVVKKYSRGRQLKRLALRILVASKIRGKITSNPLMAIMAVFVGTFMTSFHTRLFSQALNDLRGVYSITFDEGAWLNTIFNAPQMLLAPAIPFLAICLGTRRVLLWGAGLFILASLLTPFAKNYQTLFVMHGINGILLGIFVPTTLMTVFRNLHPKFWLFALSIYCFRLVGTLNSGTSITGFYIEDLGWEWIYWQASISSLLMLVLVWFGIPKEKIKKPMLINADWGGMVLFGITFTILYIAIDNGNRLDWFESGLISACFIASLLLFSAFIIYEKLIPNPWAPINTLFNRNLLLVFGSGLLYGVISMSNALLIPNFLGVVGHLKAEQSGEILLWVCGTQIILVPLAIYTIRRINAWYTLIFAFSCFAVSCLMASRLTHDWAFNDFLPIALLMAVGHAFGFLSIMVLAVSTSDVSKILSIMAYVQIIRVIGPAIGSTVLISYLRVREQVNSFYITSYLQSGSPIVEDRLQLYGGYDSGLTALSQVVAREANVLAYVNAYQLCFVAALIGIFLVGWFKPIPPNPLTPHQSIR